MFQPDGPATDVCRNSWRCRFANRIWRNNPAEVMGHQETDAAAYNAVIQPADLGMSTLQLHKEQPGYISNSMFRF
ncbi:MAG: hypothetical protein V8T51_02395 [Senegalimassilia faecalis]